MPAASSALTAILCALVEERTGLNVGPPDRLNLVAKVRERATVAGYASLLDYYYFLRYDAEAEGELQHLTDSLVVNESYFFRELDALKLVVDHLGPGIAAGGRPRVWSAACASGEEPLTLAMLLAERAWLPHVDLIASDISLRALARARLGRFGRRAVRSPPPAAGAPWLGSEADGTVTIAPALVSAIDWRQINLCQDAGVAQVGTCDVILCRNVLIYFAEATVHRVLERLTRALAPGGILIVGVSESLLRFGTSLTCEEAGGVFFYRKAP